MSESIASCVAHRAHTQLSSHDEMVGGRITRRHGGSSQDADIRGALCCCAKGRETNWLEPDRDRRQRGHGRGLALHPLAHLAPHRHPQGGCGHPCDAAAGHSLGVRFRRRWLHHADVLRLLRAAHDRPARRALPHGSARQFHQLYDRPQSGCHGLHRRSGAPAHLLGVGPGHRRRRENSLRHRADVLARQRVRAWLCSGLRAWRRDGHDASAGVGDTLAGARRLARHRRICGLVVASSPLHRLGELADRATRRGPYRGADRHRHSRFRRRLARILQPDAGSARHRFRHRGRGFRVGDIAGLHQPRSRQPRHL